MATEYRNISKTTTSSAHGASTSLLHPPLPLCNPLFTLPIFFRSFAVGSRFIELITTMVLAITGYIVSGIRFKSSNLTQLLEALHSRYFPNRRWRASEVASGVAYSYRTRRNIFRG